MRDESSTEPNAVPSSVASKRALAFVIASFAVIVLGWIAILPGSTGSDEPGHIVRSAAVVRGGLPDQGNVDVVFSTSYELPGWVGWPDPQCWAFKLDVPVNCGTLVDAPEGEVLRGTRSANYPIWGHLLPGIPSLVLEGTMANQFARVFHAIIPFSLICGALALAARRGRHAAAATLLAVTPVVLFNLATVNPSGLVIAGGVGFWAAIVFTGRGQPTERWVPWFAAVSWAAMVLSRRDGLIYACVIVSIMIAANVRSAAELRQLARRGPLALSIGAVVVTFAWATTSEADGTMLLFAVPLLPIAVWLGRSVLERSSLPSRAVAVLLAVVGFVGAFAAVRFVQWRDPALDTSKWRAIVAETGSDLFEAFGLLSWLDAPMPTSFAFVFVGALGALVGAVAMVRPQALVSVVLVLVTGILMSWWLTATQVDGSPQYWQGRYYLPLMVGIPILLGAVREVGRIDPSGRLARGIGVIAGVVSMVALAAAMRRFAVGIDGTMAPWRWHTFGASVSPLFPLIVIAVGWVGLLWSLDRLVTANERAAEFDSTGDDRPVDIIEEPA